MKKYAIVVIALFLVDRLIKNIIWFSVPDGTDFLFLHPLLNETISFSIPLPIVVTKLLLPVLLIITAGTVIIAVRHYVRQSTQFIWWAMISIGALSNILDRIQLGGVLDYIDVGFFPVFNLSDVYITIGAGMIILMELLRSKSIKNRVV